MNDSVLYKEILGKIKKGIVLLDGENRIIFWNQWLADLTGISPAEVQGKSVFAVSPRLDKEIYHQLFYQVRSTGLGMFCSGSLHKLFFEMPNTGGKHLRQNMNIQSLGKYFPDYLMLEVDNITTQHVRVQKLSDSLARKTQEEIIIRKMIYVDPLTGSYNRRYLLEHMDEYLSQGIPFCLLFLDLNFFKETNDTYGHACGDLFLKSFARRLSNILESLENMEDGMEGVFAARYGGDEFAILLPGEKAEKNFSVQEKKEQNKLELLLKEMKNDATNPVRIRDIVLPVSYSLGIVFAPQDGLVRETLLQRADKAMYFAKSRKKSDQQVSGVSYAFFRETEGN